MNKDELYEQIIGAAKNLEEYSDLTFEGLRYDQGNNAHKSYRSYILIHLFQVKKVQDHRREAWQSHLVDKHSRMFHNPCKDHGLQ